MTADRIRLPTSTQQALPILAELLRDAIDGHIERDGSPPGEYEQGVADGFRMAVSVVQAAANGASDDMA